MAGLDELLAELQTTDPETQKLIAAENPYSFIPDTFDQLGASVVKTEAPLKEKLLYGLLTGILGGVGSSFSKGYQNETENAYQDVLSRLNAGENISSAPENLPTSVFQRAVNQAKVFKAIRDRETEDLLRRAALQDPVRLVKSQALFPELTTPTGQLNQTQAGAPTEGANTTPAVTGNAVGDSQDVKTVLKNKAIENLKTYDGNEQVQNKIESEKRKPWFDKIPATTKSSLSQLNGISEELRTVADRFDAYKKRENFSWIKFQANKHIAGTEANRLYTQVLKLVPTAARLGGEVGNLAQGEQDRIIQTTLGNFTSGPEDIAQRLRELADSSVRIGAKKLEAFKTGYEQGGDALLNQLNSGVRKTYTIEELKAAGYTDSDIKALSAQGVVQ